MSETYKKLEKPSEQQKTAGDVLRFINTIESGEVDEKPTTFESNARRQHMAGNKKVND